MADHLKNMISNAPRGKALMGLDVGKKTIGIAVCDDMHMIATPVCTVQRTKFTKDIAEIARLSREYDVGGYVVGYPMNMDGTEGPRCQSVRDFAAEFERQIGFENPWVVLWDERLSTVSVDEYVDKLVGKRKTKINAKSSGLIDKLAAQIILQGAIDFLSQNK